MNTVKPTTLGEHLSLSLENFERFYVRVQNYGTSIHRLKALIDLSAQAGELNNGHASEAIMLCEQITAGDEAVRQFARLVSKFVELTNEQRLQHLRIVLALLGDNGMVNDWLAEMAIAADDVEDWKDEDLKRVKVTAPIEPDSFRVGPSTPMVESQNISPITLSNTLSKELITPIEPPPVNSENVGPGDESDGSEEQIADDSSTYAWAGDPSQRIDPSLLGNLLKDVE